MSEDVSDASPHYGMTISLNVLNHLGLNLYSNNPAVLSEAVANAWDADAKRVDITLDIKNEQIVVQDDGIGMTLADVNERFLRVGHQRRQKIDGRVTPSGRRVMGRKGIGKLAMFGIARTVLVETAKDGQKHALQLDLDDIEDSISSHDPSTSQIYEPQPVHPDSIDFAHGTRITLTNLKVALNRTAPHLRKRLARRFTVIGPSTGFEVFVGGKAITADDMEIGNLAQYGWVYGSANELVEEKGKLSKAVDTFDRGSTTLGGHKIRGWIGTAYKPASLKGAADSETLNRLPIYTRGKLAQEDLLDEVSEAGIYKSYLMGEIHADFLDTDDEPDIATSSRQKLKEDDPRYEEVKKWLEQEMNHIKSKWTDLRNQDGVNSATANTTINAWFQSLKGDRKRRAKRLFGKINQLGLDPSETNELYAYGILAFETMYQKENLDALDAATPEDLVSLGKILTTSADLEAAMYHNIVKSRLRVIDKLDALVVQDAKEKFLQDHLFSHLWLLDPSWERASLPTMEKRIGKEFAKIEKKIPKEERDSRYDIRYQRTSGQHVIVELKRASVLTHTSMLLSQVSKYRDALRTHLANEGKELESVAVVCVVGRPLKDWDKPGGRDESSRIMDAIGARVVLYDELIANAQASYREYILQRDDIGKVQRILDELAPSDI